MPQNQAVSPLYYLLLWGPIMLIFYFLLIRPQKKQEKERQLMLSALNKNDEVVTNSGIHGTIVTVKEKTIILRVDDNVKIEMDKNSIALKKQKT